VVWASNTGQADLPYFERFARWFAESRPGTKVDLVHPPGEWAYEAKLITMFAGGTYPDVFHLHVSRLREFWAKGLLAPFAPYLKAGQAPMEDFIPGVLVPFRIKGQTWGRPRDNATGVMYFNRDLFAGADCREGWRWKRSGTPIGRRWRRILPRPRISAARRPPVPSRGPSVNGRGAPTRTASASNVR
jgi:ABC-type glycerol-3-phosphate transport system substrate-binding protein